MHSDHQRGPEPGKKPRATERPPVVDPFQSDPADPFVAPAGPERGDPFQPDEPTAKKATAREPNYADPFESKAAAAKTPAAAKKPSFVDPFEPNQVEPKPQR